MALVTAGVEYDVLGIGYEDLSRPTGRRSSHSIPGRISNGGFLVPSPTGSSRNRRRRFGNVKADVLEHYVPGFERGDFVRTILDSPWPE